MLTKIELFGKLSIVNKTNHIHIKKRGLKMNTFFTSDTHFHNRTTISLENRPFNSTEEMKATIIANWNKVVSPNDTVYHLGDVSFGTYTDWVDVLTKLNGRKVLILGNHDDVLIARRLRKEGYLAELHEKGLSLDIDGKELCLSHYPLPLSNKPNKYSINGHVNSMPCHMPHQIDVGVSSPVLKDKPFGQPLSLKELQGIIKTREVLV